jgi:hypothetical protein
VRPHCIPHCRRPRLTGAADSSGEQIFCCVVTKPRQQHHQDHDRGRPGRPHSTARRTKVAPPIVSVLSVFGRPAHSHKPRKSDPKGIQEFHRFKSFLVDFEHFVLPSCFSHAMLNKIIELLSSEGAHAGSVDPTRRLALAFIEQLLTHAQETEQRHLTF